MSDSPAAAAVWRFLEDHGCSRTTQRPPDGRTVHIVQIWRQGALLATGEHVDPQRAACRAMLDAVQVVPLPERTRPVPMPSAPARRSLVPGHA